jgi:OmpA-OmpF porin, OOP family
MICRKQLLMLVFLLGLLPGVFGQESPQDTSKTKNSLQWANRDMTYRGKNYDLLDSSYIPKFRFKQFKKYINHQTAFPPKPRTMWEVGAGFGLYNVIGNVPTLMLWEKGGAGLHIHVRKSLGYIFSLRAQYIYGVGKNLDNQPTTGFDNPYTAYNYVPYYLASTATPATPVYRATRTESSQLTLDLIFNVYNISFHRDRNQVSFFGYFGIGALGYKTRINALDAGFGSYDFSKIVTDPTASASTIKSQLQSKMDNTYESAAPNPSNNKILDSKTLDFAPSVGVGFAYKINKQINLQIEERYIFPSDGYLDGSPYGMPLGNIVAAGRSSEAINYFSIGVNYNVRNKKKSIEPLYWINPIDHLYQEISYPRHMILPTPMLLDEDGDGVCDQFDRCPKTPAGVPVDVHGCPLDTDGDGVPDYRDKQLITPTECQPVDADGVGKCPCPEGCGDVNNKKSKCGNIADGTLYFTGNSVNEKQKVQLATLASQMKANPDCKVVVVGAGSGSKLREERSWEHVNAVIEYMSEKQGISSDRFIFQYGKEGDDNVVSFHGANADETGPSRIPPPHPELINK